MFVNPFAIWTAFVLKTGEMMLASMRAQPEKTPAPRVGFVPATELPPGEEDKPPVGRKPPVRAKAKGVPQKRAHTKSKLKAAAKVKPKARRGSKR